MHQKELKSAIDKTIALLLDWENRQKETPILRTNDPSEVKLKVNHSLPEEPISFEELLSDLEKEVLPFLNRNTNPRFAAYITGSGNMVSSIAEFIKAYYNQNGLKWNNSPIASEMEQLVIRWVADFVGLKDHQKGVLTSGGSMSNLMCIHLALAAKYPDREMKGLSALPPVAIYCSDQTHSSIERALVFLGLGRNSLRKIKVNESFQIDLDSLKEALNLDVQAGIQPFMLIGNAGTTNTGSIDDLNGLADIAQKYDMWYHVDGAYGLPARRVNSLASHFYGVEQADSVIINPHKWMYVPFEASCVLVKTIPKAINFEPDYLQKQNNALRWESSQHTIELSKEFRALKVWFTIKYYGAEQLTNFVKHDIDLTHYFGEILQAEEHIEVEPNHPLSIICFRWNDPDMSPADNEVINQSAVQRIENEGKIFITGTKLQGQTYLRAYFGNPNRTKKDVEYMRDVVMELLQQTSQ